MTDMPELKSLILQLITKVDSGNAELRQDIDELRQDVNELKLGQVELRRDVNELKLGQAELRRDVAELKQGQAELRQDVTELKRDVGDLKRVTSSNHFIVTGRLDEQRGVLMDHIAKPLDHAHPR
jgi:chromosome segregation ATPase